MAKKSVLKVAMILTDGRDDHQQHELAQPFFGPAPATLLAGLEGLPDLEVHVVSCVHHPVPAAGRIGRNILHHAPVVGRWGWLRGGYLPCIFAVRKCLREIKPDVVHGQGTERYCALAAAGSGRPNVITLHGNMRSVARANSARPFSFLWLAARLEAWTIPRVGGVVCLTRYTQRMVEGAARRTWVVPNAVAPEFLEVPCAFSWDPAVILCVGTIVRHKNQNRFIRALDAVAASRAIRAVFLGDAAPGDPYGDEFRALVAARPWCLHAGFADRTELKDHLGRATLLALPSLEDNCPMVVLEAMAAGLPVAGARIGGVPDLVQEGVTGTLFDPEDEGSIRAGIASLLAAPDRARAMGEAGRRAVRERFHPEVIARAHLEIYRELLAMREQEK